MIVGAILDSSGRPICCEIWPGNVSDVTTLIPIVERLKTRFAIASVCVVADRGVISSTTIEQLESEELKMDYILGARMRMVKEVRGEVLFSENTFTTVTGKRLKTTGPSPLKVREQWIENRRYIVCHNEEQARKDAADRVAIVESLRDKIRDGDKGHVGNNGYRKYLKSGGDAHFTVDEEKIDAEKRFAATCFAASSPLSLSRSSKRDLTSVGFVMRCSKRQASRCLRRYGIKMSRFPSFQLRENVVPTNYPQSLSCCGV
jgi:hypothetical protein